MIHNLLNNLHERLCIIEADNKDGRKRQEAFENISKKLSDKMDVIINDLERGHKELNDLMKKMNDEYEN